MPLFLKRCFFFARRNTFQDDRHNIGEFLQIIYTIIMDDTYVLCSGIHAFMLLINIIINNQINVP